MLYIKVVFKAVKSIKYHRQRIVGTQILTNEEFTTLNARTEAMLDSRPLMAISTDPNELEALTPGHLKLHICQHSNK